MNIGFASVYSFRPHVEHLSYVADLLRAGGQKPFFLTCDAQFSMCYARALRHTSAVTECPKCIIGGIRSFQPGDVDTFSVRDSACLPDDRARNMVESSALTLVRTETRAEIERRDVQEAIAALAPAAARAYASTRAWIERRNLQAIVVFNGRMDATRAMTEAAADLGVPFVTMERTWFSDGLQLTPNANCLDLRHLKRLNQDFSDKPLTERQARRAARYLASRQLRRNTNEWRAYNKKVIPLRWPASGAGARVLILPGSRNEVEGHPDWEHGWSDFGQALDAVFEKLALDVGSAVIRCHPNWGQKIGVRTGELSEDFYTRWAQDRGVYCISSRQSASTNDLIDQAELVIVTGGSSAFEAGALGKPVISLGPATYLGASCCFFATGLDMLETLSNVWSTPSDRIARQTLHYGYTHLCRMPQYFDYVKAVTPTRYRYFPGADPERLMRMIATGQLEADDATFAIDTSGEDRILAAIAERDWETLLAFQDETPQGSLKVQRRPALRWIDAARELLPRGDT